VILTVSLSCGIFFIDALTPQRLVVSILQDVPIALTGLTLRRRFTVLMVLLGIVSNILAEAINAHNEGAVSALAIANRFFSVISFLLVGYLAMKIQDHALEAGKTLSEKRRSDRDRRARELLEDLSRESDPSHLLKRLPASLRSLLSAKGVILAGSLENRWSAPILSDPPSLFFWPEKDPLPGGLALLLGQPLMAQPISQLSLTPVLEKNGAEEGLIASLRSPDSREPKTSTLLLFVLEPRDPEARALVEEMLPVFGEVLKRLELLQYFREKNAVLSRRNAMIRDLVTGVSHDIRTPLLAQNMNMNLAQEGVWGPLTKDVSHLLDQMIQSNQSILDLSNRLLLLSQYELNDLPLFKTSFSLKDLLEEIFQEIAPLLHSKALTISRDLCPDQIIGDRTALKRLFLNLLDNAIKGSPPNETIDVSCHKEGGRFIVAVADSGPGVPKEIIPRLFQRFGGLKAGSGFGLGLYLSQQIARLHGGQISYHPGSPGCCFAVDLPEGSPP
jgi:signal transduction histidine kinase